ncbi:MAG TPA: citrate synthase [Streptosporangiaceae bacterium]
MTEWIGTAEAARRLGIKEASLYSYVSRGLVSSRRSAGTRASEFNAADVERLARRGRPRVASRPGQTAAELMIETALTEIADDQLRYRGIDAITLASQVSLEDVAALLWTGSLPEAGDEAPWTATAPAIAVGTAAQAALPAEALPLERLQVIVPALAAADPLRLHLDPPAVATAGRCLVAGMVECLPQAGSATAPAGGSIAERLITRLCPDEPRAGLADVLRSTLVLLADHELAASTLAARVAASVRADPYAVVATGLGAVGGALHGGASFGAETMLRSAVAPRDAQRVVGELLRRGERIPGFGHFVYQGTDPRGVFVFERLRQVAPDSERLAVAEAVMTEASSRALPAPNIDFALAAFGTVGGMISGAGEAIFAVARAVGWIAHAMEQYGRHGAIRPRGIYTGPSPAV